ncbi:MAG TPA: viroplasmin family protein [Candidatus Paceibacterota bacterium]|nr:viroplasmin family protein [Candidatus Paceibacterota bacterium]
MAKKSKFYAYFIPPGGKGRAAKGVADDWKQCEKAVIGKPGARFKAFESREDAEAWLARGAAYEAKPFVKLEKGIYFDAGTGRGEGVEVSVTDEKGTDLLHKAVSKYELNQFGKHLVANEAATNNYGELLALRYALEIAKKTRVKKIFGDSRLVIEYWSKWRIKRNELPDETVALAHEVAKMREAFESGGGSIARISGGRNPADLGFHRS